MAEVELEVAAVGDAGAVVPVELAAVEVADYAVDS